MLVVWTNRGDAHLLRKHPSNITNTTWQTFMKEKCVCKIKNRPEKNPYYLKPDGITGNLYWKLTVYTIYMVLVCDGMKVLQNNMRRLLIINN